MKKITTIQEITKAFIADGWNKDTTFSELTLQEAKKKGYLFALSRIKKGHSFFKMEGSGNIYDDYGNIAYYNLT